MGPAFAVGDIEREEPVHTGRVGKQPEAGVASHPSHALFEAYRFHQVGLMRQQQIERGVGIGREAPDDARRIDGFSPAHAVSAASVRKLPRLQF